MKTKGKPENVLLTIPEVAALVRVSRITIWHKVKAGKIPAYRIAGSPKLRVWLSDILLPYRPGEPLRTPKPTPNASVDHDATMDAESIVDITTPVNIVDTNQS